MGKRRRAREFALQVLFQLDITKDNPEDALRLFKRAPYKYVLSMHCLDQGVDIPDCHSLIFLSSSGNPREYIQRRGRVLRNYQGKPTVNIYDTFVFPSEVNEIYSGIVMTQLLRAWEFLDSSQTPEEANKFDKIREAYGISESELRSIIREWWGN